MLTEAGETFEQRETELQKLKDLVQEYEQKLESQVSCESFLHLNVSIILIVTNWVL